MAKPKKDSLEQELAKVSAIRKAPEQYVLERDLAPFLEHNSNHAVAAAADVTSELEATGLETNLIAAFTRLMKSPATRDPGCKALIAIASALATMGAHAPEVYLAGIRHVQMEGSFGPPVDAASPLRALCARGLVRMGHPDALLHTLTVLADKEIPARVGAARALADSGSGAAELVLRLKVLQGDVTEVMSECFTALLSVEPHRSIEFVARYLHNGPEQLIEVAALALGESHLAAAFTPLQHAYESHVSRPLRKTILLAIAMLRKDEAVEFLLLCLEREAENPASDALAALNLYSADMVVVERAREIVTKRNSALLKRLCLETLG